MSILRVANLQFNASGTKRIDYDAVADDGIIKISAEAVRFPVGSNGTRPPSEPGLIRYNSDVGYMEFGGPTQWIQVASNSVYDVANLAFAAANASTNSTSSFGNQVTASYNTTNAAYASINSNWTVTNTVYGVANAAFDSANNVGPQIAPAFNQANAAYTAANNVNLSAPFVVANAAFDKANTALQNTSGVTFSGNLSISGNLDLSLASSSLRIPVGTIAQRPTSTAGMLRYNSSYNNLELYNGSYWFNIGTSSSDSSAYDGSSSSLAALSAWDIKMLTGTNTDGVYWINLPTVGATQVYCLMDDKWAGGGWMMAMKATRGTTFNYASTYWTAINTLNPTDNTRNDADAKYNSFNYYRAKDLLALWPDIGQGGMLQSTGCWSWVQNNFMSGAKTTLYNLFSTGNQVNLGSGRAFGGFGHGVFSSQSGWQWYGLNYQGNGSYRVRWGFAWNNETDQSSNDVSGGIGMDRNSYSAGDYISSAQDITGMNRSARVEMYIR